jgi:glyoxylase-like metal-dependent hydrolase (beta-lactamase superfamily II)
MITTEVADRVHRIEHAYVNVYLVEDEGRVLLVDTGLPRSWGLIAGALRELGRRADDVVAVALTHAHFDHTGNAARVQQRLGVPILAHPEDFSLAAHPYRYAHENPRAVYPVRYPSGARILLAMTRAGAWRVPGVEGLRAYAGEEQVELPGRPRVVATPGHTYGHVALHLPGRDTVISGDALVTLDPYTGRSGPQIVAGAATADSAQALASLDRLAATRAGTVLPGHGEPWTAGVATAVELARERGAH